MTEYRGATWVRTDFHLHTPAVPTFRGPAGLDPKKPEHRQRIARQYVDQLLAQGIQLAAITDYNAVRPDWFSLLRGCVQDSGIVLLPAAELSFEVGKYGLHVLALFPQDSDIEAINRAINALDVAPAKALIDKAGGHREIQSGKRVEEALADLRRQVSPLLILAHASDDKGVFRTFDAQGAARFLAEVKPDAIENFSEKDRKRLTGTGQIKADLCNRIACVEFSDPKAIAEIGTKARPSGDRRATFLKLSDTRDVNAIRLALQDPEVRVAIGEQPIPGHTRLLSVKIEGAGFLQGLDFAFSPDLDVLIGGRGVGKSALLEVVRYALDLTLYTPTDYRLELVRYALGSGGKVLLEVAHAVAPGIERTYRIDRVLGESPRVFELNPEREVELPPRDVLAEPGLPLFFGQREIYDMTRSEEQRVRLIDEIIGRLARQKQEEVLKMQAELRTNARELSDLDNKLGAKADMQHRLKEIEHEIELYKREGLAEKLKNAALLAQDEELLEEARETVDGLLEDTRAGQQDLLDKLGDAGRIGDEAGSPQADLLKEASQEITATAAKLKNLFAQESKELARLIKKLERISKRWTASRRPLDIELGKVKQKLAPSPLDPNRLEKLTKEQTSLKSKLEKMKGLEKQRSSKEKLRQAALKRLRESRYDVFKLRQDQAQDISSRLRGRVRAEVEYKGQVDGFVKELADLFQGSGIDRKSIEKLARVEGKVIDGLDIAQAIREAAPALEKVFGLTSARASQLIGWAANDPRRLYDLELLSPDDFVQVFLKVEEKESPLARLSDGQRATAMLLLLLVQVERLLIVDQPEDDLDNRFIYEDIVRILREQKGGRQVLVATHNPNIPVLGDAELIVALESSEGKGFIADQGSVDRESVRDLVKRIMEGGEDAFRLRAEKYGWGAA